MSALWPVVLRQLRSRPLRALLSAVAVALGVAAVLGVQLALPALDEQARQAQLQRAGRSQLDVRWVGQPGFDDESVKALRQLPGVQAVVPLEEKRVAARANPTIITGLTVTVVGVNDGAAGLRPVRVLEGRLPADASTDEVAIDQGLADALQSTGAPRPLTTGDDVRLVTGTGSDVFHIVGITAGTSAGAAFTRSAAYVSEAAVHGPFAQGLRVPLVALRITPATDPGALARAIRERLGSQVLTVDPRAVAVQPLEQLRPLLAMVTVLSVFIGAGVVANSLALGVVERRREIGLLRAAGASRRHVFRLVLMEAAAIAVAGAAVGFAAGLLLAGLLVQRLAPADLGVPAISISAWAVVSSLALGVAMAILGAVVPARLAARMNPLAALRSGSAGEPERTPRSVAVLGAALLALAAAGLVTGVVGPVAASIVALLLGTVFCLPFVVPPLLSSVGSAASAAGGTAGLAASSLARRRNRTSMTVAGLAVAVSVAVAVSALTSGALAAGQRWVDHVFLGDVLVRSPATQSDAIAQLIENAHGVRHATPLRFLSAAVAGQTVGLAVVDPRAYTASAALDVGGDRTTALVALESPDQPAMVIPKQLAEVMGWHDGQRLSVDAGHGAVGFTVAGVASHTFPGGDGREAIVVGRPAASRQLGEATGGFDALDVTTDGTALASLRSIAASYGMQALSVSAIADAAQAAVDHSVALLSTFAWLAVVVAMLAVVNTLLVNVRQGARELGLLRAVGLSRRRAQRLVLAEAALLAASGVVVGIAAGCLLALPLLHASGGPGFDPGFVFPLGAVVASIGAVIAGALLAVALPARAAAGQSIVGAIRHA